MATEEFKLMKSDIPVPEWWKTRVEDIQNFIDSKVTKGTVNILSVSPGNRKVYSITYGEAEPELKGTANFGSALGAGNPDAYYKRGKRKRPVLVILAGVHGAEVEGIAAAVSIVSLMETGKDLEGKEQPALLERLGKFRLIVVPMANPDGRVRIPYDGWVGLPMEEMTLYSQGTRKNGELYRYPGCKTVHPMAGDVGLLGGYFDDAGVNLMHDQWHSPMSGTTSALLQLVADEGPDMLLNLHSAGHDPGVCPERYIPFSVKERLSRLIGRYEKAFHDSGVPYAKNQPAMAGEDGHDGLVPPSFNLNSMFYHTGAELCCVFESPDGNTDHYRSYSYSDFLVIHHLLIRTTCEYLIENLLE